MKYKIAHLVIILTTLKLLTGCATVSPPLSPEEIEEIEMIQKRLRESYLEKHGIVQLIDYKVRWLPEDFSRESKPYRAHVRAYFQFRNNSNKTLTGLIYEVKFLNSFGDVLYKTSCKDQLKINPGKQNPMDSFWYWKDNPFIDDEPYDRLQAAARAGTIKVRVTIQKAVFSDGSVVELGK